MSNDAYIDDDEMASEKESASAYQQYLWEREQDERDLPPHKRSDYAERMYERADELRKLSREMML